MNRRYVPGLVICTIGLLGPVGCANKGGTPLTAALFVRPGDSSAADSLGGSSSAVDGAVADVPALPAGAGVATNQPALDRSINGSPKNATVLLSDDTSAPFDTIKPLEALQVSSTTQPNETVLPDIKPNQDAAAIGGNGAIPASALLSPPSVASSSVSVPSPASADALISGNPPSVGNAPSSTDPVIIQGQGGYLTLGGVLAVVNSTPIYANQVLTPLRRELAVKAKDLDEAEFKRFAREEIGRQFQEMIEDELYFATAYHELTEEDRKLAQAIAMQVRGERITAAGGSVEEAERKAIEEGDTLDAAVKKEYRRIVHQLAERRRIEPMIQVSADSMRSFYRMNADKLYTDKDKAQFRVIEIDPEQSGGPSRAMEKIQTLHERAIHGADFTALSSDQNDSSFLKGRGGSPTDPGEWIERNTYVNEALEAELWKLQPGQITPVVQANQKLYIAKLEAKHVGVTRSFEDRTVQDDIYSRIHKAQFAELWRKSRAESESDGIVSTDPQRQETAIEMAMQKYAQLH